MNVKKRNLKKEEKSKTTDNVHEAIPNESEILAIALLISSGHLVVSKNGKNLLYCDEECEKQEKE